MAVVADTGAAAILRTDQGSLASLRKVVRVIPLASEFIEESSEPCAVFPVALLP